MSETQEIVVSETKAEEPKEAPKASVPITLEEGGKLVGKTFQDQRVLASVLLKGGTLPKAFATEAQVLTGIQYAVSLGLEPIHAMRQMYWVNGSLCLWGDQPKALVDKSGLLEDFEEYPITEKYDRICVENKNLHEPVWGVVCRTKRKGHTGRYETFFTLEDARTAGLIQSNTYKKYLRDMLTYRARARNLKSNFADALGGAAIAEYDHHQHPTPDEVRDATPTSNPADDVNANFGGGDGA